MDPLATSIDNLDDDNEIIEELQTSDNDFDKKIMKKKFSNDDLQEQVDTATEIANNINNNLDHGKYTNEIIRLQNLLDAKNHTLEEFSNMLSADNKTKSSIFHLEYKELSILILLYCLFAHPQTNQLIDSIMSKYISNPTVLFIIKALLIALLFHLSTKFIKSI